MTRILADAHIRSGGTSMLRTTTLLAALLCLAGCGRLGSHPIVTAAKEEVSRNPGAVELLGESIEFSPKVTGRANETDGIAAMQFEAKGAKASATVVVEGKKLGDEWGVTLLEVRPTTGDKLSLTAELAERMGVDTPKFDPSAKPTTSSAAPPPGDIEITLPPGGPGAG
jgi:hypothetical protein